LLFLPFFCDVTSLRTLQVWYYCLIAAVATGYCTVYGVVRGNMVHLQLYQSAVYK